MYYGLSAFKEVTALNIFNVNFPYLYKVDKSHMFHDTALEA